MRNIRILGAIVAGVIFWAIFLWLAFASEQQRFSLTDQCSIITPQTIDNAFNQQIQVGTLARCHTDQSSWTDHHARYYPLQALLVKRNDTLYVHPLLINEWAGDIKTIRNKNNTFILFKINVQNAACKFRYVLVHATKDSIDKEPVNIGCTEIATLSISGDFVYVMTSDNSLEHAYLKFYGYDYTKKAWKVVD